MYLAFTQQFGQRIYEIRQSFFDEAEQRYAWRTIFDLGTDPARYISQPTDDICFFSDELRDRLGDALNRDPTTVLEDLLWQFLPAEERRRLELFRQRSRISRLHRLSDEERVAIEHHMHLFDRRRLYYLRYGAVDQSRLVRVNPKLYRPLLYKSRDEREFYLRDLEQVLSINELKTYVFAIFDLQRHFDESFSATMPEALNQVDIADHFVEDLCKLNQDEAFRDTSSTDGTLDRHLVRYLIMFFDYGYGRRSLFDDFVKEFMGRHRAFRWPDRKPALSTGAIERAFAISWQQLQAMSIKELQRLYRRRAKELHPDSGGHHDLFVELNSAYAALLVRKKQH